MTIHLLTKGHFPCPVCAEGLDVRTSKKGKPYVVCDRCGIQMFVRTAAGIEKFEKLVAEAQAQNIWGRLRELQGQYEKKCPECGKSFWANDALIATSWFNGSFIGFKCPEPGCDGIAKPEEEK